MAGWLHGVFVVDWLFVFPLCGFSLSLFCNYLPVITTLWPWHEHPHCKTNAAALYALHQYPTSRCRQHRHCGTAALQKWHCNESEQSVASWKGVHNMITKHHDEVNHVEPETRVLKQISYGLSHHLLIICSCAATSSFLPLLSAVPGTGINIAINIA